MKISDFVNGKIVKLIKKKYTRGQIEIFTEVKVRIGCLARFRKSPGDSEISKSAAAGLGVGHKFKPRIRTGMRN